MATVPTWLPSGWFPGQGLPIVPGTALEDIILLIARRCRRSAENGSNFQIEIISEIIHAQRKLEEGPTLPWFLKKSAEISVGANDPLVPFDSSGYSIIRLQDDKPLAYQDPTGSSPEPIEVFQEAELKILTQKYPGTGAVPKEFYVETDVAIVRPTPTQALTYVLRFYHHDTEPVLGAATLWTANFPDLIMNLAGFEIAWSLRNTEAAQFFERGAQLARDKFVKAVTAREEAGQEHIMGDD